MPNGIFLLVDSLQKQEGMEVKRPDRHADLIARHRPWHYIGDSWETPSAWGEAMTLGTRLLTWFRGELVGTDGLGNRYYRERGAKPLRRGGGRASREKRWVIYQGEPEGSKVPQEWHAWLHHTVDEVPRADRVRYPWEKEHQPNMTGTPFSYYPPGSVLRGGQRARATGDYEPWIPE